MLNNIRSPFGGVKELNPTTGEMTAGTAASVTIGDGETHLYTPTLAADQTLNLAVDPEITQARLVVYSKTSGTQVLTFGTNIDGAALMGVAGKTITREFVWSKKFSKFCIVNGQVD